MSQVGQLFNKSMQQEVTTVIYLLGKSQECVVSLYDGETHVGQFNGDPDQCIEDALKCVNALDPVQSVLPPMTESEWDVVSAQIDQAMQLAQEVGASYDRCIAAMDNLIRQYDTVLSNMEKISQDIAAIISSPMPDEHWQGDDQLNGRDYTSDPVVFPDDAWDKDPGLTPIEYDEGIFA